MKDMKAVIYARFSSSSQREASIDEQVKVCKDYAEKNNYEVVKVYSDSALTGKTDERPALKKLLTDSSKNNFNIVLVYSIDRFGRDLVQTLLNEKKLSDNNVVLISATEHFSNDPSGVFFRNIMMSYAQYYSDELSVKIKRGMDYNAEKCLYNGGGVPLGYKIGADKHFEINPETAFIVKDIYEMYANGNSISEINSYLNSQGLKTNKGVAFNKNSLHTILKNKRYLGYYIHSGREIAGGIPQIIPDELFERVQEKMNKNKKAPARARAKVEYLLTTKLFCGHCKEMMTGFSGTGKQGKTYRYYICNGTKYNPKTCDKKRVNKEYIENIVITECKRLLTAENIRRIAKEVVVICESERDVSNLKRLKKLLSENERKQQNAITAIMESDIESVRKALGKQIPILEKEHTEIEKMIAKEEAPYPNLSESAIRFFLTSLKKGNINDIKYRKTLVRIFVNKIFLYDDRITITYNSGDEPVNISDHLLSKLEENSNKDKFLFKNGSGPPNSANPNSLFFIDHCFGFVIVLEDVG